MFSGFDAGSSTVALPQFGAACIVGSIFLIIIMESVHIVQAQYSIQALLARLPAGIRWSLYGALILAIFNLGATDIQPFIYFQF
jgi:hypothetical protein